MKKIDDIYELSSMQQGMLFHSLYDHQSEVYFEQLNCIIQGQLNIKTFKQAWQRVIERHAIFRTSFHWEGLKKPVQIVHRQVELPFEEDNWCHLSKEQQKRRLDKFLRHDRSKGFVFSKAPLMRMALIQISRDSYYFVWSHSHLLLDRWSLSLVLKEVFDFYEAFCSNQDLCLEPVKPYRDYILWLQQQNMSKTQFFWQEYLQGFRGATPLGVDRLVGRNLDQKITYGDRQNCLSAETTTLLSSITKKHHITLNTLIQGVWALLLSRYSHEEDVVFGITMSSRPVDIVGVDTMIGLFINTLPLRVKVPLEKLLIPWLKELQLQQTELARYDYCSLAQIQRWSDVPSGQPLFESILVFENIPGDNLFQESNRHLNIQDFHSFERTNYPLTVIVVPGSELLLRIFYDQDRFEAETVERMLKHLVMMLEMIVEDVNQKLQDLPLLTASETHQLLEVWNNTETHFLEEPCLHHLFEAQVEKTPDAVAVVFEDKQLTYRELNRRANQLAHYLRRHGVGPDISVGICVERSLEMVIGLYGILKAGGAYIPLDPDYPRDRLIFMMQDAKVPVLLTQERLVEQLPKHEAWVLCLDTGWETVATEHTFNPDTEMTADNLAYCIYTSGSTGMPKGAMNSHWGICNRLHWMQDAYQLTASDRVMQKTPFSFDVSVWEFFWPLITGSRLVVAQPGGHRFSKYLVRLIVEQEITTLHFVPSMLQVFLEDPEIEYCTSLKRVICSGEALPSDLRDRFFARSVAELHNLYGPTEAAIDVTFWNCEKKSIHLVVPIGRPISNTQIYILDAQHKPVPVGVPNELYIGGVNLARGYLNRPGLTAEKFIPNLFGDTPGSRLYKTGDLARFMPDGNIEFIGRTDSQVKIRGLRIELGEIEATLVQCPEVLEAVVIVREDEPGDKRLVAYVVSPQNASFDVEGIKGLLKKKLPDYMVPVLFVPLETLPLMPNGKVNRKVLPKPDAFSTDFGNGYVPPRDLSEWKLVRIWEDVLNIQPVGIKDSFFTLGGHSLLAVNVVAQIERSFHQKMSLPILFDRPTVEQIATFLRKSKRTGESIHMDSLVKVRTAGDNQPFFCVHPVGGNIVCYLDLEKCLSDHPFYAFQSRGLDGVCTPFKYIEDMATHYVNELQEFKPNGPYCIGGWSMGSLIAFEMAQQLQGLGQQVALLALIDPPVVPVDSRQKKQEDQVSLAARFIKDFVALNDSGLPKLENDFSDIESDQQAYHICEQLKEAHIVPADFEFSQIQTLLNVFKANLDAMWTYKPRPYTGQITLIKASKQPKEINISETLGWEKFAKEKIEVHKVPGDHYTMMQRTHVHILAEKLSICIQNSLGADMVVQA